MYIIEKGLYALACLCMSTVMQSVNECCLAVAGIAIMLTTISNANMITIALFVFLIF